MVDVERRHTHVGRLRAAARGERPWQHYPVSTTPPIPAEERSETGEVITCYAHPKTPTGLRCTRCDRPICGRCAIPASVGQHCPECVAEARKSAPKVRSALRANAPVVFTLLVINVVIWVLQSFVFDYGFTQRFGAQPFAIAAGEWYRLISPMFLHAPGTFWHIGFNSYALFIFGPHVEQAFGRWRFLLLYLIAGFTGSAASYAFGACNTLGVGASGAIFGVLGGLFVFLYNRRREQFVREFMKNIIFLIVVNLAFGFLMTNIDNLAHLGGLIGGAAVAAGLDTRKPGGEPSPLIQVATVVAVVAAAVALVAWRTSTFSC